MQFCGPLLFMIFQSFRQSLFSAQGCGLSISLLPTRRCRLKEFMLLFLRFPEDCPNMSLCTGGWTGSLVN
jgi:hypothetical protein